MSKWIDADALIERWNKMSVRGRTEFDQEIMVAPSIDIVRCQDCKYWVYHFNGCARNPCIEPWYATDGCTYGERKENE